MFDIHLHNDYYCEDYKHKDNLNEEIRDHISGVWKQTVLYFQKYDAYLIRVLVYCFILGLCILLVSTISYTQIDWGHMTEAHKKFYKFFTFLSLSFWMYITIIILSSEAIVEKLDTNKWQYEIHSIFNNSYIDLQTQIQELREKIDRVDKYIQAYIGISTTILYVGFLTVLGIMF